MVLKDYLIEKPTIESKNLRMRPFRPEDVEDLLTWTPNREIYRFWGKNPGKADLKPELLLNQKQKPTKSFHLYIENKEDKKVIGDIYLYLIEKNIKGKVAIRLNPTYHHRGLGTEAVRTLCAWCFEHTELQTLWTDVDKNNTASIKMLDKCGFSKVKEVTNGKMVSAFCDYSIYELQKNK